MYYLRFSTVSAFPWRHRQFAATKTALKHGNISNYAAAIWTLKPKQKNNIMTSGLLKFTSFVNLHANALLEKKHIEYSPTHFLRTFTFSVRLTRVPEFVLLKIRNVIKYRTLAGTRQIGS